MNSTLHTRQSSIYSDKYKVSYRYGIFSWWWAHSCPKHVEKSNKFITKICAPSWFYLQKIIQGCRSTKHKILFPIVFGSLHFHCIWRTEKYTGRSTHILIHASFWVLNNTLPACRPNSEVAWTTRKVEQACHRDSILIHTLPNLSDWVYRNTSLHRDTSTHRKLHLPQITFSTSQRTCACRANWIEQQQLQTVLVKHTFRIWTRRPNILIGFRQCL